MKTKIYYSVANGGDGSAYPVFFEEKICADIHQELIDEGWGEDCTGELQAEAESPIKFLGVMTRTQYIKELEEELEWDKRDKLKKAIAKLKKNKAASSGNARPS